MSSSSCRYLLLYLPSSSCLSRPIFHLSHSSEDPNGDRSAKKFSPTDRVLPALTLVFPFLLSAYTVPLNTEISVKPSGDTSILNLDLSYARIEETGVSI